MRKIPPDRSKIPMRMLKLRSRTVALLVAAVLVVIGLAALKEPEPENHSNVPRVAAVGILAPKSSQAELQAIPRIAAAAVAGGVAARTRILASPVGRTEEELRVAAAERRGLLRDLIQADPAAALACRLTYAQRRALPAAVSALLEQTVDTHGQLEVIAVCGPQSGGTERFVTSGGVRRRAFLAGSRVQSVSQERLPVHGIAIDDVVAVAAEPYRLPDLGEFNEAAGIGVAAEGITVLVGEERRVFAAKEELDEWADRTRAAETVLPSVFGQRKILFVMVDFPDAPCASRWRRGVFTTNWPTNACRKFTAWRPRSRAARRRRRLRPPSGASSPMKRCAPCSSRSSASTSRR